MAIELTERPIFARCFAVADEITPELLRYNSDKIFCLPALMFGSVMGTPHGPVANKIRNTFWLPVRRTLQERPPHAAFFSDRPDEMSAVERSLRQLYRARVDTGRNICFPVDLLSSDFAPLHECSPVIHGRISSILAEHFGVQLFSPLESDIDF